MRKLRWMALSLLTSLSLFSCGHRAQLEANPLSILPPLVTDWTKSFALYPHPHAIWLTEYDKPGCNLGLLNQVLIMAEKKRQQPELVIYTIPFRDIDQSSQGGFDTIELYLQDNQLIANDIKRFVDRTKIHPRIYLEPDALAHAWQYKKDKNNNEKSQKIFKERIQSTPLVIRMYKEAGAQVYLDAAHSGWFDYNDDDVMAIASVLNQAGVAQADGITTNVSNRQKIRAGATAQTEWHYLSRLLPLLQNKNLDIIVDTSRNGGTTHARRYHLAPDGHLIDNELPQGRWVGTWRREKDGELWVMPFFGTAMKVSVLTAKDKYTFNPASMVLNAPPWLDAVGDVQVGDPPKDNPGIPLIHRFRHIKPPDDCDGSLNCPPGESKEAIKRMTAKLQPTTLIDKSYWANR